MAFRVVVLLLLGAAAGAVALVICRSRGGEQPATALARVPVPARTERVLLGTVVTELDDPLPHVDLLLGGVVVGRSDRHGEFCLVLPEGASGPLVARRGGFLDRSIALVSEGDQEVVVHMDCVSEPGSHRFFAVDALSRGVPGLRFDVHAAGSADVLWHATSGADGSVRWSDPDDAGPPYDLHVVRPDGEVWSRGLHLTDNDAVPIGESPPSLATLRLSWQGAGAPDRNTKVSIYDGTVRSFGWGTFKGDVAEIVAPQSGALWMFCCSSRIAMLLPLSRSGDEATLTAGSSAPRVELAASPELVASVPVLEPDFGEPRVVYGRQMTDIEGGTAFGAPRVEFVRRGERLITPALDLDPRTFSIRATNATLDRRIATIWPSGAATGDVIRPEVRVRTGTASVTLQIDGDPTPDGLIATLARRGGGYRISRPLHPGDTCTWRDLCAGAFVLTIERIVAGAPSNVHMFDAVRRVAVEPGSTSDVRVRIDPARRVNLTQQIEHR